MATLRESLQAEIDTLEQKLASKKAALDSIENVLELDVEKVGAIIRAIASHVFPARVAPTSVAPVVTDHTPAPSAPSVMDRVAEFLTAKPSPAQLP